MKQPMFILNGPPNSGKDMLADAVATDKIVKLQFKECLYEMTAKHYNIPLNMFKLMASCRALKEIPVKDLGMLTPRQALIHVSEEVVKPAHGKDFFGIMLAQKALEHPEAEAFIVSDGGFADEIPPLKVFFDVCIIHLHRPGCTFNNDSRNWIDGPFFYLINDTTEESAIERLKGYMDVYPTLK